MPCAPGRGRRRAPPSARPGRRACSTTVRPLDRRVAPAWHAARRTHRKCRAPWAQPPQSRRAPSRWCARAGSSPP
eukprot:scaffold25739_cov118-Isochrysis_galbana.AAC.4